MLRKMYVVCLILEHFPLKPGSLKILPPCAVAVHNILDSLPVCEYSLRFGQHYFLIKELCASHTEIASSTQRVDEFLSPFPSGP